MALGDTVDLVIFAWFNFREFREDKFANLGISRNYYYNSATVIEIDNSRILDFTKSPKITNSRISQIIRTIVSIIKITLQERLVFSGYTVRKQDEGPGVVVKAVCLSHRSLQFAPSSIRRRGRSALVDRLAASPVMHASRVRTPLKPTWVFQENLLVSPFSM